MKEEGTSSSEDHLRTTTNFLHKRGSKGPTLSSFTSLVILLLSSIICFWYGALYLSALYTPEWSRCEGDDTMTSFNPALYFSCEGELLGLQPKVILQFCVNMGKILPFPLHPHSRKNKFRFNRIFSIYHTGSCILYWTSAQCMSECSTEGAWYDSCV